MNKREKILAILVCATVGSLVGDRAVKRYVWAPLRDKEAQLSSASQRLEQARAKSNDALRARVEFEDWRRRALPPNVGLAQTRYQEFLRGLLSDAKIDRPLVTPRQPSRRRSNFVRLAFQVELRCKLDQLERFLADFFQSDLLHQIRTVSVTPVIEKSKITTFNVSMKIEAVSLRDAVATDDLPIASGSDTDADTRPPSLFVARNLFQPTKFVPPEVAAAANATPAKKKVEIPDGRKDIFATGVVIDGDARIWMTNRKTNTKTVLGEGDELRIGDQTATILRINASNVVLRWGDKVGSVRLGESLASLKESPVDALD